MVATAGLGLTVPAAASAPRDDPTITINAAGTRTGATGNPAGLAGMVFTATGNTNGATGTCTTNASGTCTISITTAATQTYTITPTTVPPGWFSNPVLGIGAPPLALGNTGTTYDTITTGSLGPAGSTTVPVLLNTSSTSSRGSQLAFSRTDPREPTTCGLKVALLFDLSTSIVSPTNNLAQYLDAGKSFVTALQGTPSEVAVYSFGTNANTTGNNGPLRLTPVSTAADADAVRAKIGGLTVDGSQYTNTDAGLWQIAASGEGYDVVLVLTDGDPTRYGRPTATALPSGTGVVTRFIDVENSIFSANAVKVMPGGKSLPHPAVLAVGVNVPSPGSHANLRAITADGDFDTTDFAGLASVLDSLARDQCLGSISVVKQVVPHGGTIGEAKPAAGWEFTSTAPAESKVTDDTGGVSFETGASTTPTTITETPKSGYTSLPRHTHCVNNLGGAVPVRDVAAHRFTVTPDPDGYISCYVYNEAPPPAIHIVKSAYPTEYGAVGQQITYTYTVKNTGQVTLHDITVTDDRMRGPVTCEATTLAPGESTTCQAIYTITEDDIEAGHVVNTASATGHPPVGPPVTDEDTDTVHEIHGPGIEIQKTAFPVEYAAVGEVITYSYHVVNTGTVTLHGITVTDSRLGAASCPHTTLAPAASMICHATHTISAADVAAGHIPNAATATGHPPTGPPVTDKDTETIHAIHRPAIEIQKTASPTAFGAAGERITVTYQVVNTGNATLRRITVTDSKVGRVSCPHATLAPGESMTCHATYITTAADVANGQAGDVATAAGHPPTGPPVSDRALAIIVGPPLVPVTG